MGAKNTKQIEHNLEITNPQLVYVECNYDDILLHPKGYHIYKIIFYYGRYKWYILKRFKFIHRLYRKLCLSIDGFYNSSFPRPKRIFFGRKNKKIIEKRRKFLIEIMTIYMNVPIIYNNKYFQQFAELSLNSFNPSYGRKGKEGYLRKCSGGYKAGYSNKIGDYWKSWKKRWIVLYDSGIVYYRTHNDKKPLGILHIDDKFEYSIVGRYVRVSNSTRTMAFYSRHKTIAQEWVAAIDFFYQDIKRRRRHLHHSFSSIRPNTDIKFYIKGEEMMKAVTMALLNANHHIYIAGWQVSPLLYLLRPPNIPIRLTHILKHKAEQGIKIYVILYKEVALAMPNESGQAKNILLNLHPNIKVIRHPNKIIGGSTALLWSHHDKIVVVDDRIAFVGGIDLAYGRWDTKDHTLVDEDGLLWENNDFYNPCMGAQIPIKKNISPNSSDNLKKLNQLKEKRLEEKRKMELKARRSSQNDLIEGKVYIDQIIVQDELDIKKKEEEKIKESKILSELKAEEIDIDIDDDDDDDDDGDGDDNNYNDNNNNNNNNNYEHLSDDEIDPIAKGILSYDPEDHLDEKENSSEKKDNNNNNNNNIINKNETNYEDEDDDDDDDDYDNDDNNNADEKNILDNEEEKKFKESLEKEISRQSLIFTATPVMDNDMNEQDIIHLSNENNKNDDDDDSDDVNNDENKNEIPMPSLIATPLIEIEEKSEEIINVEGEKIDKNEEINDDNNKKKNFTLKSIENTKKTALNHAKNAINTISFLSNNLRDVLKDIKTNPNFFSTKNESVNIHERFLFPRMGWHDVHVSFTGVAARDVAFHFTQRWNHHRISKGNLNKPVLIPPTEINDSFQCGYCENFNKIENQELETYKDDIEICPRCNYDLTPISYHASNKNKLEYTNWDIFGNPKDNFPPHYQTDNDLIDIKNYSSKDLIEPDYIEYEVTFPEKLGMRITGDGPIGINIIYKNGPLGDSFISYNENDFNNCNIDIISHPILHPIQLTKDKINILETQFNELNEIDLAFKPIIYKENNNNNNNNNNNDNNNNNTNEIKNNDNDEIKNDDNDEIKENENNILYDTFITPQIGDILIDCNGIPLLQIEANNLPSLINKLSRPLTFRFRRFLSIYKPYKYYLDKIIKLENLKINFFQLDNDTDILNLNDNKIKKSIHNNNINNDNDNTDSSDDDEKLSLVDLNNNNNNNNNKNKNLISNPFTKKKEFNLDEAKKICINKYINHWLKQSLDLEVKYRIYHISNNKELYNTLPNEEKLNHGTCDVQILRSIGSWSTGQVESEKSIYEGYLALIQRAKHFIYIENQFFISNNAGKNVKNRISEALFDKIKEEYEKRKEDKTLLPFRVIIIVPLHPEGDYIHENSVKAVMHYQYRTICRGKTSLINKLIQECPGIEVSDYLSFYSLKTYGVLDNYFVTNQIYVHDKLIIIDDDYMILGSANINDRSMVGARDSEIAIWIHDKNRKITKYNNTEVEVSNFIQNERIRLWKIHLGIDENDNDIDLTNPIKNEIYYNLWMKTAQKNTTYYEKALEGDSAMHNSKNLMEHIENKQKKGFLPIDDIKASNMLAKIKGHLVMYPLEFLEDEKLNVETYSSIEGLLPDSIWL